MSGIDRAVLILSLLETPGVGWKTLDAVLRRNAVSGRTPEEFLGLTPESLSREYGIRDGKALITGARLHLEEAARHARWMARSGVFLITILDATYPSTLAYRLEEAPPALFAYGSGSLLESRTVAAANSNGAPESALSATDVAVSTAVEAGYAVVTGHNRPAYQRPALAARRNGGSVIYVLDRGLLNGFGGDLSRALFPAARIWGPSFDAARDLALSPFPLRAQGLGANNRRRDAVIFALADVLLAAHTREGGVMERECASALVRGQRVLRHSAASASSNSSSEWVDFCDREAVLQRLST